MVPVVALAPRRAAAAALVPHLAPALHPVPVHAPLEPAPVRALRPVVAHVAPVPALVPAHRREAPHRH